MEKSIEDIIKERIEKEAEDYIMPARYTETAMEFDKFIAPRIRSALEIVLKQNISQTDRKKLITMLKDAHTACNGYLPFGLQLEIFAKLQPGAKTTNIKTEKEMDNILANLNGI